MGEMEERGEWEEVGRKGRNGRNGRNGIKWRKGKGKEQKNGGEWERTESTEEREKGKWATVWTGVSSGPPRLVRMGQEEGGYVISPRRPFPPTLSLLPFLAFSFLPFFLFVTFPLYLPLFPLALSYISPFRRTLTTNQLLYLTNQLLLTP